MFQAERLAMHRHGGDRSFHLSFEHIFIMPGCKLGTGNTEVTKTDVVSCHIAGEMGL